MMMQLYRISHSTMLVRLELEGVLWDVAKTPISGKMTLTLTLTLTLNLTLTLTLTLNPGP